MIADEWATGQMTLYEDTSQQMDAAQDVSGLGSILSSILQGHLPSAMAALAADAARPRRQQLGGILGWTALYGLAGILVAFSQPDADFYLWYPPIAIGAAFLALLGLRFWPAVFLADLAVSLLQQGADPIATLITSGSTTFEIVAMAAILRLIKIEPGAPSYRDLTLVTVACLGTSLFGATLMLILSSLFAGALDTGSLGLWLGRWIGHATSGISLLPPILMLCSNAGPGKVGATPRPSRIAWEEIATISMALAVSYAVFGRDSLLPHVEQDALRPLIVVPILWAVVRGHARTAAAAILATVISAMAFHWLTHSLGSGEDHDAGHAVLALQISLVASAVVGSALSHAIEKERNSRARAQAHEFELKQLADELQVSVTRLSLAAEAGKAGVWEWNLVDDAMVWDDAIFEMYQIDRDESINKHAAWLERVHPDDVPRVEAELDEAIKSGREVRSTFRIRLPDGDVRHFNAHAIVQKGTSGRATRMIGIDYDVTELVTQRLKAEENERRAVAANRAKSEFLAVMSHELRTPLNAIIGFSDLMAEERLGPIQNERYKAFSNDIRDSGHHLLSLINDILDVTRIESGRFDLNIEPVDPCDLNHEVAEWLAPSADAKRIRLTVAPATAVAPILGDRLALRKLMKNLVANSIKFTNEGGEVNLATRAGIESDTITLVVSDNGRGIPKERIADLGQPFVQVSDSLRRDVGGLGLGLAIVRSLTEAMDGRLEINSELGVGTSVCVTLPAICRGDPATAPQT